MLVVVLGAGIVVPLGLALPMQWFPERAGQASALTGFLQQEGTALLALALLLAALVRQQGRLL